MKRLCAAEQAAVDRIDPALMLARVTAWSAINSGTGNIPGLAAQAQLLAQAFSALPGEITLTSPAPVTAIDTEGREVDVVHGQHLVLRVRPDASRRLLLTGHMDTVYAADHPFQTLTWTDAETLNGPGVADMKGGLSVMLEALTAFEQTAAAQGCGYDVLINSDEEVGSLSSASLIAELARGKAAALTYEPSALPDGTLAGDRGGSGNYSLVVTGRSAHAGRNPGDGRNAIVAAAALVLGLERLQRPGLSINPARVDGGSPNNVVPALAIVRFNIRPTSTSDAEEFDKSLKGLLDEVGACHEVEIRCHGQLSRPPRPIAPLGTGLFELVRTGGEALGHDIRWIRSGGVCDGNNIGACGVPVVDTLGVRGGAIHSPGEYLIVPSLAERAALSAVILHRLAMGEPR